MAAHHPKGMTAETVETARRTLNKILSAELTPTQPTRDSIARALVRNDAPAVADDDAEEESDQAAMMRAAYELDRAGQYRIADDLRLRARRAGLMDTDDEPAFETDAVTA